MNEPHVQAIYYRVESSENVDYENAPPIVEETDDFTVTVDNKQIKFRFNTHFSSASDARKITDDFINRYDVLIGLENDPDEIRIIYSHPEIIDLSPPDDSTYTLNVQSGLHAHSLMNVELHVSRNRFPSLPTKFLNSPNVETMYNRYKAYRQNREPLTTMAFVCLTTLEAGEEYYGEKRRERVEEKYYIDKRILNKLGELTSERGDQLEIRKFPKSGQLIPLTPIEKQWIEEVIKAIILRVGEAEFSEEESLPILSFDDFPEIPD